jgi:hypothetical protein
LFCAALGCMATLYTAYWMALCNRFAGASQISHAFQLAQIEKSATGLDGSFACHSAVACCVFESRKHERTKARIARTHSVRPAEPFAFSYFRAFVIIP